MMRPSTMAAIGGTTMGLAGVTAAVIARRGRIPAPKRIVQIGAGDLRFDDITPGAALGAVRGDPHRGAYAAFARLDPGFAIARHIHTHDVTIVVIRGAYIFGLDGESEPRRLEAGSYLIIPGGTPHWSAADPIEGAFFFQEGTRAFDLRVLD